VDDAAIEAVAEVHDAVGRDFEGAGVVVGTATSHNHLQVACGLHTYVTMRADRRRIDRPKAASIKF